MLHGHSHGKLYKDPELSVIYKKKILDVGVDMFPHPPSLTEINERLKQHAK
jgi:calcineurin-like phosphoesterase family protein